MIIKEQLETEKEGLVWVHEELAFVCLKATATNILKLWLENLKSLVFTEKIEISHYTYFSMVPWRMDDDVLRKISLL